VSLNRAPAVELAITPQLRAVISDHFSDADAPLVMAIEIAGEVVIGAGMARLPVSEGRLVISGGMTASTARELARVLGS
jgi:hypothetical protein